MSVSLRRGIRFAPLAAPVLLAVVLAACGGDDGDARVDVTILPTSFVTRPPVTTAAPTPSLAPGETLPEGTRNPNKQTYEVQGGDNLSAIASMFDVDVDEIIGINEWPEGMSHPIYPGDEIDIPPNALDASEVERNSARDEDEDADEADADTDSSDEEALDPDDIPTGDECPDGSDRPTYEIQAGDIPGRVANDLDITIDQLTEANAGNNLMSSFPVGAELLLPCDSELETESTN